MNLIQNIYDADGWMEPVVSLPKAQLILAFGDRDLASDSAFHQTIKENYPTAQLIGCTTSGQVCGTTVADDCVSVTVLELESSHVQVAATALDSSDFETQIRNLAKQLPQEELRYVLVLSDGNQVNGTELIRSLKAEIPEGVTISGGLAGDDDRFEETLVWHNEDMGTNRVLLCGFYGDKLGVSCGTNGGWSPFGPKRTVTKSDANVLYELDGKPALDLYKRYLGDHAQNLPASALLFPLQLDDPNNSHELTRTILSIDEDNSSMTFAGNIPEGSQVTLMQSNINRLIEGAELAAENAYSNLTWEKGGDGLVMMISCVGRRLVMDANTPGEVEAVQFTFGDSWQYCGFYSYGEIASTGDDQDCVLHNQTMTVTAIYES